LGQDQNMAILTWRIKYQVDIISWATINEWPSWPWSYGSWIYNYLCNRRLSPLMVWVRIPLRARCTTLCDEVCQWLPAGRWFSPGTPVSSNNKTDSHDITESGVKHHKSNQPTNQTCWIF